MDSDHCWVLTQGYTVEEKFRQENHLLRQIDDSVLEMCLLRKPTSHDILVWH